MVEKFDFGAVAKITEPKGEALGFVKSQPLYYVIKKSASDTTGTKLTFFDPAGSTNDEFITNVSGGNKLPKPDIFIVDGFSFLMFSDNQTDIRNVFSPAGSEPSLFTFRLGGTKIFEVPLILIPSCAGLTGFASTTANNTTYYQVTNGTPHASNYFRFRRGKDVCKIMSEETFDVLVQFKTSITLTADATFVALILGSRITGMRG